MEAVEMGVKGMQLYAADVFGWFGRKGVEIGLCFNHILQFAAKPHSASTTPIIANFNHKAIVGRKCP